MGTKINLPPQNKEIKWNHIGLQLKPTNANKQLFTEGAVNIVE